MIALSIALVISVAITAWLARDIERSRQALTERREHRTARTAEAERLDTLEADIRRIDKVLVAGAFSGGASRR